METATTSIVDIDLKVDPIAGEWTLCTATGADKRKYKTFDVALTTQLRNALKTKAPIKLIFEAKPKEWNGKPYTERTVKQIAAPGVATTAPATAQASAPSRGTGGQQMPPEYWENKAKLDFQRTAHMSALKAAAEVMVALINAKVESYKYEDALTIVTGEAKKIYASYYQRYEKEGASNDQPSNAATAIEYADEYERAGDAE